MLATGVLAVALVTLAVAYYTSTPTRSVSQAPAQPSAQPPASPPASGTSIGESQPLQDAIHIDVGQKASYQTDPPSSGPHYSIPGQAPMSWGYYDRTMAPEYWVHNLEHGGVVLLYNCAQDCTEDQAKVKDFVSRAPKDPQFGEVKMVAVKYVGPGHRFAMVAWGWRFFMDTWDADQAQQFYTQHVDHGPEAIP